MSYRNNLHDRWQLTINISKREFTQKTSPVAPHRIRPSFRSLSDSADRLIHFACELGGRSTASRKTPVETGF